MKKKILVGAGAVALAVVAVFCWRGASTGVSAADEAAARRKGRIAETAATALADAKPARQRLIADARPAGSAASAKAAHEALPGTTELSAEDQKLVDALQVALDAENLAEVRKLAEKLVNHPVAEVRQRAIEALQWFGEKALDSMTMFLADADEDVQSTAMDAVEQALAEMEDESAKLNYIESLFQVRGACDEDALAMLAGQLKGLSDSAAVIDAAVRVIEANANPAAVREMKEVYEFITGEPYTTRDAAQLWRAENAEPPESADSATIQ